MFDRKFSCTLSVFVRLFSLVLVLGTVSGCLVTTSTARSVADSHPRHTATLSGDYYDIAGCVQQIGQKNAPAGILTGNHIVTIVDLKQHKTAYVKLLCTDCQLNERVDWEIKFQQVEPDRVRVEYRSIGWYLAHRENFDSHIDPCRF